MGRIRYIAVAVWATLATGTAWANPLILDGQGLQIRDLAAVARDPTGQVAVTAEGRRKVAAGFDLVMAGAAAGTPIYGLTVGVGWNKDRPLFRSVGGKAVLEEEVLEISRRFNRRSFRAQAGGVGEPFAPEIVRAGMIARLNTMLSGVTGAQPAVMESLLALINAGITPVVPSRGSVGEADITLTAHIGLAMMGEWQVDMRGRRMPAAEALAAAGIPPVTPIGKDFLAIVSTNALIAGQAALLSIAVGDYLDRATVAFGLALEGLNGNVAPILPETTEIRPYRGMVEAARAIAAVLDGSHLWQPDEKRALQDPLSFRTMAYVLGNAREALAALDAALAIQINHTDDNPAVVIDAPGSALAPSAAAARYRVASGDAAGAILPTAGFEMLPVAVRIEHLTLALARLSQNIVMQTIRFENPDLTKLPRFLAAPTNDGHAFGAMQKPLVALFAENRMLAMPVSLDTMAIAGGIEDTASNAPLAAANLDRVLANMYLLSSIQLLHAAQAVELRGPPALGRQTRRLFEAYRARVPYVTEDRAYTADFVAGVEVLRAFVPQR